MAQFGASIQTAQISGTLNGAAGIFNRTVDPYQASLAGYPSGYFGARNPLGAAYYDNTPISATNPNGFPCKYRYVRYLSTSNPALTGVTGPFLVYWTDATFTTVTPVSSESLGAGIAFPAGFAMPNLTSIPTLVNAGATTSQTNLGGNYIWICVGGYLPGAYIGAAAVVANDFLIGTTTNFLPARSATVPTTSRIVAQASTAAATNLANILVTLES